MSIILKAENISKQYRLGNVGTGTLSHDLNRWWHQLLGKEDPYVKVGAVNNRSVKATEDYIWALKEINFEVQQGEVLGIIGKNGAGKSTLLKILSRVTSPTTGSIKTKGRIASLLEVGTGFHPELTGKENIYLNGAILGMNKAEINSKIDEIIDFSGCQMYIDTPVKRYSSGMRVRLAFAVAAFLEPDILVVDEVLAVGDAEFQKKAIGKMQDISKGDGRTVIFVSHNMAAVQDLCSRVIILTNGEQSYEGDVQNGVSIYLNNNFDEKSEVIFEGSKNTRAYIHSFSITNSRGDLVSSFKSGEKMIFSAFINLRSNLVNPSFSLRLTDAHGTSLVTWRSLYFKNSPLSDMKTGKYQIHIASKELYLLDGTYYLSMSLLDGKNPIDIKKEFIQFSVVASKPSNEYITISRALSSNCLIYSNSDWTVEKLQKGN